MECYILFSTVLHESSIKFLSDIRDSRMAESLWGMIRGVGVVRMSEHQSWLAKRLGLGLLCWGSSRSDFVGRGQHFKSGQWHFHQSTSQSLSQTIWPRWTSRQFFTLPIPQTLLPVTFGYSLSSEAVVMRQLTNTTGNCWRLVERGCGGGHWHAYTRGLPWGLPEVIGTVQQVHCSRSRLLRRGLEFHVCTINKSSNTKKVWKLL